MTVTYTVCTRTHAEPGAGPSEEVIKDKTLLGGGGGRGVVKPSAEDTIIKISRGESRDSRARAKTARTATRHTPLTRHTFHAADREWRESREARETAPHSYLPEPSASIYAACCLRSYQWCAHARRPLRLRAARARRAAHRPAGKPRRGPPSPRQRARAPGSAEELG